MKLLAIMLSVFLLSGCATADYYKYLTAKEDRVYKDRQFTMEQNKINNDKEYKNKQLDNDKFLKEKELNNNLEIEKFKLEQERLLKEKELQTEKEKYEF